MRQCQLCGKGSQMGGHRNLLRGHYNPTPHTRKYPNLQYAKVEGKRLLICTSCLRTMHRVAVKPTVNRKKASAKGAARAKAGVKK